MKSYVCFTCFQIASIASRYFLRHVERSFACLVERRAQSPPPSRSISAASANTNRFQNLVRRLINEFETLSTDNPISRASRRFSARSGYGASKCSTIHRRSARCALVPPNFRPRRLTAVATAACFLARRSRAANIARTAHRACVDTPRVARHPNPRSPSAANCASTSSNARSNRSSARARSRVIGVTTRCIFLCAASPSRARDDASVEPRSDETRRVENARNVSSRPGRATADGDCAAIGPARDARRRRATPRRTARRTARRGSTRSRRARATRRRAARCRATAGR